MESSKETYSKLYNVKGGQIVSLDDILLEFALSLTTEEKESLFNLQHHIFKLYSQCVNLSFAKQHLKCV